MNQQSANGKLDPTTAECQTAYGEISKTILKNSKNKDNAKIYQKMLELAQLKMAYRLATAKERTLEDYAKKSKDLTEFLKGESFPKELTDTFKKYGVEDSIALLKSIQEKNQKGFDYSNKKGFRMDNETAAAFMLYLSVKEQNLNQIPESLRFTESDAASVWALGKIAEKQRKDHSIDFKRTGSHNDNSNLLEFSVRVCQQSLRSDACGIDKGKLRSAAAVEQEIIEVNEDLVKLLGTSAKDFQAKNPTCFTNGCDTQKGIDTKDLANIQARLRDMVASDAMGHSKDLNIDFSKTTFKGGSLEIHLKNEAK